MAESTGGIDKGPEILKTPETQKRQAIREFVKTANNSGLNLREIKENDGKIGFEQTLGEHSYPIGFDGKNLWLTLDSDPKNLKTPDDWNTNSLVSKDHPWITQREGGSRLTLPENAPLAALIKNLPKENSVLLVGYDGNWKVDKDSAKGKFQIDEKGSTFVDLPEIKNASECKAVIVDFGGSWQSGNWVKGSTQKFTV